MFENAMHTMCLLAWANVICCQNFSEISNKKKKDQFGFFVRYLLLNLYRN